MDERKSFQSLSAQARLFQPLPFHGIGSCDMDSPTGAIKHKSTTVHDFIYTPARVRSLVVPRVSYATPPSYRIRKLNMAFCRPSDRNLPSDRTLDPLCHLSL